MTVLQKLIKSLKQNEEVVHYATIERNYLPLKEGGLSQIVDIIAYPTSSLHSPNELNEFIESLVPKGIAEYSKDEFWDSGQKLRFGKLCLDEVIGEVKMDFQLTDENLFSANGFVDGRLLITEELKRRILVRVFPDQMITRLIYDKGYEVETDEVSSKRMRISEFEIDTEHLKTLQSVF